LVIIRPTGTFRPAQTLPISQRDIVWVTEVETAVEACSELPSKVTWLRLSPLWCAQPADGAIVVSGQKSFTTYHGENNHPVIG
jgi:hypothetical protein